MVLTKCAVHVEFPLFVVEVKLTMMLEDDYKILVILAIETWPGPLKMTTRAHKALK